MDSPFRNYFICYIYPDLTVSRQKHTSILDTTSNDIVYEFQATLIDPMTTYIVELFL